MGSIKSYATPQGRQDAPSGTAPTPTPKLGGDADPWTGRSGSLVDSSHLDSSHQSKATTLHQSRFGGYQRAGAFSAVMFNSVAAGALLLVSLPFLLIVPILILVLDGPPVLYRGERMGKDKKLFYMYKFRTLLTDAERKVGGHLLNSSHGLETRSGKLLRETRLDELPQLINVLRGDMNLVGPRPERRAVYEQQCKDIAGYDVRFQVKPGLIGYSQIVTPHSAPKKARVLIDNYYVRQKQKWHMDIVFFLSCLMWLGSRAAIKILVKGRNFVRRLAAGSPGRPRGAKDQRASERIKLTKAELQLRPLGQAEPYRLVGRIDDVSDHGLAFWSSVDLSGHIDSHDMDMVLTITRRFMPRLGVKRKMVRIRGRLLRVDDENQSRRYRHVFLIQPLRAVDLLTLHQYFLGKSIA